MSRRNRKEEKPEVTTTGVPYNATTTAVPYSIPNSTYTFTGSPGQTATVQVTSKPGQRTGRQEKIEALRTLLRNRLHSPWMPEHLAEAESLLNQIRDSN